MATHSKLWIAVVDGEHGRILTAGETAGQYRTERSIDSAAAHQRSADLVSDRAGRSFESATPTRHAIAPRNDPHDMAKHRFVEYVARQINEAAEQGLFGRLVLAAPSHALNDLRAALSAAAAARLVGVVQKDLTRVPDAEIGPHLTWDAFHLAPS